jgi:hypothetical protein
MRLQYNRVQCFQTLRLSSSRVWALNTLSVVDHVDDDSNSVHKLKR